MPAEGRENPLLKKGNSDAFFREKYLTKNNGLNHYKVPADFNIYRLSPLAPHRVRFAPQNRLFEPADCNWHFCHIF